MAALTTTDLINTLSNALGLPLRTVEATARHLRESGLLPAGKAGVAPPATIGHATRLLLALMLAPGSKAAPDSVRLYAQLPFTDVSLYRPLVGDRSELVTLDEDDSIIDDVLNLGQTFGAFLTGLIEALTVVPDPLVDPGHVMVGGGLGTARATVVLNGVGSAAHLAYAVRFTLAPLGGGVQPDDAPRARLDREAVVPGTIFQILRDTFADHEPARASEAQMYELRRD